MNNENIDLKPIFEEENFIITDRTNDEIFINLEDKEKTFEDYKNILNLKEKESLAYFRNFLNLLDIYENSFFEILIIILKEFDNLTIECKDEFIKNYNFFLKKLEKLKIDLSLENEKILINIIKNCIFSNSILLKTKIKNNFKLIINFFSKENIDNEILPIVLELLHDEKINNILIGLELMIPISKMISLEMLEIFVTCDLLNLSNDEDERIRMESFEVIINLADKLSENFINNKFNENLIRLINDKNWQVKNIFINNIINIKNIVHKQFFEEKIFPYFIKYLKINNKWVKENTISKIGELLINSKENSYKEDLLNIYLKIDKLVSKNNVVSIISCILPNMEFFQKIIKKYGSDKWIQFKELLENVLSFNVIDITLVLSKEIHYIANSIDNTKISKEFLPLVFKYFLDDKVNIKIKNETINNLVYILELLEEENRDKYADLFMQIQNDTKNWRIRKILGSQMNLLSKIFSNDILVSIINPICLQLCRDQVSQVRINACANIFYLFSNQKDENNLNILIENIKYFSEYNTFHFRQSFILICNGLINKEWEIFVKYFLKDFDNLVNDKVINVRITLIKTLFINIKKINSEENLFKKEILLNIFNKMRDDKCIDVINYYNDYYKIEQNDDIIELDIENTSIEKKDDKNNKKIEEIDNNLNNDKEEHVNNDKEKHVNTNKENVNTDKEEHVNNDNTKEINENVE